MVISKKFKNITILQKNITILVEMLYAVHYNILYRYSTLLLLEGDFFMQNNTYDTIMITCRELQKHSRTALFWLENLEIVECGYKEGHTPPAEGWAPLSALRGAHKHYWIRGSFKTPAVKEGQELVLAFGATTVGYNGLQGLLYLNGEMIQGVDRNHAEAFLQPETDYEMLYYLYSNDVEYAPSLAFGIKAVYTEVEELYYDMVTPFEALGVLNENTDDYKDTYRALIETMNLVDFREPHSEAFFASIRAAKQCMKEQFYDKVCTTEGKPIVHCIGHTHIDVEWKWARAQTREKVQRSFSIANELMKKYPEYVFTLSQPELYRYLKEDAPDKYAELKEWVKQGRWEPEGAMWLESDCNLVSGESFVRQLIQGKKFFKDEFGVESKVLFLPDVFGYSAALPQILKKAGVEYFITSKISWNDTNCMPYDSFVWQGIDGSEIFTSFITTQDAKRDHKTEYTTTYVCRIDPSHVLGTWDRYQQKEYNKHTILTFGWGDGGGGPTKEMLEKQRRLAKGLPGMPVTKMDFVVPYLDAAHASFEDGCKRLQNTPKWIGELYLEFHRGTYTTMAKNKRGNRKSELALQKAEALSFTHLLHGGEYDADGLYAAWRKVLHNQFHDILPGSSIQEVYDGTDKDYAQLADYTSGVIDGKLGALAKLLDTNGGILVYNPLGFAAKGTVIVDGKTVELTEEIPGFGWKVLPAVTVQNTVTVDGLNMENAHYRIQLDTAGRIASLYDKDANREVVQKDAFLNELQVFEDGPYWYDAWDIFETYKSKKHILDTPAKIVPVTDGTRSGVKISHQYMHSTIEQTIWLYSDSRRIDVDNDIDWHDKQQMLKVAFPVDIHVREAAYEIQFGHVYRPTHSNTSWDQAKFEVCGHKWVDVSENGYGFALLNDCKYGFNTEENVLKLTILKSATYPNPRADEGKHVFSYSLLPHCGDFREAGVIKEAYVFNQPLTALAVPAQKGTLSDNYSLCYCDEQNVVLETVKKAENGDDMIVRLYEAFDSRSNATVHVADGFNKAYLCDLMENELEELAFDNNTVSLPIKNFEILTLKFKK